MEDYQPKVLGNMSAAWVVDKLGVTERLYISLMLESTSQLVFKEISES